MLIAFCMVAYEIACFVHSSLLLLLLLQACQQSPGAAVLPTPPSWMPLVRYASSYICVLIILSPAPNALMQFYSFLGQSMCTFAQYRNNHMHLGHMLCCGV
jgi:hypothetical protein